MHTTTMIPRVARAARSRRRSSAAGALRKCVALAAVLASSAAMAGPEAFSTGPVIDDFGPVARVPGIEIDADSMFRVAFDVAEAAEPGQHSRKLESAARFLNMHAAAGLAPERMSLAIVVHGAAALDLVNDDRYGGRNANRPLVEALVEAGVTIVLCGQTAAYRDIDQDDLLPGVRLSLSAMTTHAELQRQGYTLNPF